MPSRADKTLDGRIPNGRRWRLEDGHRSRSLPSMWGRWLGIAIYDLGSRGAEPSSPLFMINPQIPSVHTPNFRYDESRKTSSGLLDKPICRLAERKKDGEEYC